MEEVGAEKFRKMVEEVSNFAGIYGGAEEHISTVPLCLLTKSALSWKDVRQSSRPATPG